MKQLLIVCIIFAASSIGRAADFYPQKAAEKIIGKVFKKSDPLILTTINLTDRTSDARQTVAYLFTGGDTTEQYYAVFTESKGRYDMFDYLLITNDSGTVLSVKVIKYRSEHGGEVAAKKWLSQFENFSGGTLEYGRDISAISGATLSAGSLTRDIPEVVEIIQQLFSQKDR